MPKMRQDDLTRFVVEFESNGQGTFKTKEFPTFETARSFISTGIKSGSIWPMEARLLKEIRETIYREWEPDPTFNVEDYTD